MSHLLTSGQVGNIGLNHMKAIRKETQAKWEAIGFLEGLRGHVKENIAQLYENQASSLLTESTTATNSGSFETVVFPIVRRVFSKLLANDIVSVQAMNMPIGKLFYFVPQTSERVDAAGLPGNPYGNGGAWTPQYSAHTGMNGMNDGSVTGVALPSCVDATACAITSFQGKNLYDAFYNDGLFDNSKGTLTIVTGAYAPLSLDTNGNYSVIPNATALQTAADGSVRNVIIGISGFSPNATNKAVMTGANGNQMDTESFLASLHVLAVANITDRDGNVIIAAGKEIPFRLVTQKYGKGIVDYTNLTDATGTCYLDLDLTHPVGTTATGAAAAGTATYDGYVGAVSSFTVTANTTLL